MTRQKTLNGGLMLASILLSSCAVQNLSKTQTLCNFSTNALFATSDNNSGIPHYSGKVHLVFGLISWGDGSISSAENISGNGTFKLSRISTIDEERKFLFGFGYYQLIVYGKTL